MKLENLVGYLSIPNKTVNFVVRGNILLTKIEDKISILNPLSLKAEEWAEYIRLLKRKLWINQFILKQLKNS